jgi:RNA-directed DNA polymerase
MLDALETGVRGGKWHTLIDKVYGPLNLFTASLRVIGNEGAAGVDHQSVEDFKERLHEELDGLGESLRADTYVPQAVNRVWIPKPGSKEKRPLGVPTVRDRVVQTAALNVLEPIFDDTFSQHSFGFRHGRGCHHALERVEALLKAGQVFVVDADLKSYFDTIPKDRFRHCHWTTFRDLDQWTRGRLRSILRKRRGGRGRGRGKDHQRWPNAFFREQGFYSLQAAHVRFVQSSTR